MTGDALVFLTARTIRNRVRVQLSRLKNVRYLLGLAFIVLYFAMILRPDRLMRMSRDDSGIPASVISDAAAGIGALFLFLLAGWWWAFGARLNAIAVSPAEAQLLIPGPISRSRLLLYKLARSQLTMLASAALLGLLTVRRGGSTGAIVRGLAYFIVLSTLSLHKIAATLTRAGTQAPDAIRGPRKWATAAGVAVLVLVPLSITARRATRLLPTEYSIESVFGAISTALTAAPLGWMLAPFRALLAPLSASDPGEWVRTLPIAAALMLVHIPWILATRAPIEEAAIAAGARRERIRAAVRAARRSGGRGDAGAVFRAMRNADRGRSAAVRPMWIRLRPHGPAWVAVVWKNLVPLVRGLRWTTVALALALIVGSGVLITYIQVRSGRPVDTAIRDTRNIIAVLALAIALVSVLVGPLYSRNDFRGDLPYLRLLRTFPLSSAELVGAEVAAASTTLLIAQVPALLVAWLVPTIPSFGSRTVLLLVAIPTVVVLDVLGVAVRNAIALAFPGWVKLGGDAGGVESVGYNVLGSIGALLLLLLLLLAPLGIAAAILVGAGIADLRQGAIGATAIGAVLAFLAITALELRFLFRWLGTIYDHIDAGELLEQA